MASLFHSRGASAAARTIAAAALLALIAVLPAAVAENSPTALAALESDSLPAQGPMRERLRAAAAGARQATDTGPMFAFGFLEFDWDPAAPGGVPGFDVWPSTPQP